MLAIGRGVELPQLAASFQEDPHRSRDLDAGTKTQIADRTVLRKRIRKGEDYSQSVMGITPQHRSPSTAQIYRSDTTAFSSSATQNICVTINAFIFTNVLQSKRKTRHSFEITEGKAYNSLISNRAIRLIGKIEIILHIKSYYFIYY